MKLHKKHLATFFFFANFSLFCRLEALNINYYPGFETQLERPNTEKLRYNLNEEFDKKCPYFHQDSKFVELINHQKIVDEMINSRYRKLVVLLADDMVDAITLAQFLTQNNRLLPNKNLEDLAYSEKMLYDLVLKNYYLYKNANTSTIFFAYPRNTENAVFARYISQKVMKNVKKVKIVLILTHPSSNLDNEKFHKEKELRVRGIFKVFRSVEKYKNTTSFVVMDGKFTGNYRDDEDNLSRDKKEELDYIKLIDSYIKSSNSSDSEKLLAIYMNDGIVKVIFSSSFTTKNYKKVITHINNIMSYAEGSNFNHQSLLNNYFSISDDEFDKCISIFKNKGSKFYDEN